MKGKEVGFELISLEVDSSYGIIMERMGSAHVKFEHSPTKWPYDLGKVT